MTSSEAEEALVASKLDTPELYFPDPDLFISSGSVMLNLALSGIPDGGWRKGRVVNIVGDKSTGKTLLAIEAITYTLKQLKAESMRVKVVYNESEAAFDLPYAELLGMPVEEVIFKQSQTVEEFYEDINKELDADDYDFMLYIEDSLDGLSSKREMDADFEKQDYPAKAGQMGKLFRKLVSKVQNKNALIMIISQVRENIGVTYGRSLKRTGGKAMDFFVSQVIWLREVKKLEVNDLVAGVKVQAKVDKNKAWKPYREVSFPILFEYGVDDAGSMVDFLIEHKHIKRSGSRYEWEGKKLYYNDLVMLVDEDRQQLIPIVKEIWDNRELELMKRVSRKPKY